MVRPPFPIAVDNTIRSTFVSCARKAELSYFHDWRPIDGSVHLVAGGAFAHGIETVRRAAYEEGLMHDDAISRGVMALIKHYGKFEPPETSAKSAVGMATALVLYFDHFGTTTDMLQPIQMGDRRAIEFTFALPIDDSLRHPVTGDPILYTGRFDMLAEFIRGPESDKGVWPTDEKTTGQMGAMWAKQWELNSQMTGYVWAVKTLGYNCQGAVVRGISVQKKDTKFGSFIAHRPDWMVERWRQQLIRDIQRMISCWREGYFDYNLGHSCSDFGGCPFLQVCQSNYPQRWLESHYHKVHWDPLKKIDILENTENVAIAEA